MEDQKSAQKRKQDVLRISFIHSSIPCKSKENSNPTLPLNYAKYLPHTHSILTAIFPGEPGLAGCPLNSPSIFIPGLRILLGQTY